MRGIHFIFFRRTLFYLAYALILTGILLYVRFPAEKFKQFCENRLELVFTERVCTIERIGYRFPRTFTFYGIHLRPTGDTGRAGFFIDNLSVIPDPAMPWKIVTLAATFYGGALSARLEDDSVAKKIELQAIRINGLDLAALQKDLDLHERKIAGTLGFTGSYQATFDDPAGGTGQGQVVVDTGSVALLQPVLSLAQIDFQQAGCSLRYENRRIAVYGGTLKGKDLTADFTGDLQLMPSFFDSEVQLGGSLVPQAAFLQAYPQEQQTVQAVMQRYNVTALPFKVGGTLNSPTFRFSR